MDMYSLVSIIGGLVNSGIMSLLQTVGIIMGSNIGTTLTAWLLSLSGVKTDNPVLLIKKRYSWIADCCFLRQLLLWNAGKRLYW